ncbi:hypothetical protein AB0C06_22325 [Micromonospora inaquosa]|uniref:DUF4760 domain-containing protein n=1 Tax=Micromonospora inaquosa TaxID=2203716 RepID=A0A3N9WQL1_9ACTN|nr:hypothetical protein [Micromonospora inaquosa]RQX03050.1 hypothetical protein DLJ59_13940 [Micromonospora inaquosa]
MTALWEQAPTFVGVAVGALLSFTLSALADRARWRRDVGIRWDPQRMTVYAEYAFAVREMYQIVLAVATRHGYGQGPPRRVASDVDTAIAEAEADRAARFEAVLLVGSPRTVAAARRWHQAVWHLECFACGRLAGQAEWDAAMREFGESRADYYRAARRELGIEGGLPRTSTPAWKAALAQRAAQPVGSAVAGDATRGAGSAPGEEP